MSDDQQRPRSTLLGCLVAAAVLLAFLYVLSIGPVNWLRESGYASPATCEVIELPYYPLAWLRDNCEPFGRGLNWYLDLWR